MQWEREKLLQGWKKTTPLDCSRCTWFSAQRHSNPPVSCFLEKRGFRLHYVIRGLSLEGVNPDSFAAQDKP
jgi:hypothetical protein